MRAAADAICNSCAKGTPLYGRDSRMHQGKRADDVWLCKASRIRALLQPDAGEEAINECAGCHSLTPYAYCDNCNGQESEAHARTAADEARGLVKLNTPEEFDKFFAAADEAKEESVQREVEIPDDAWACDGCGGLFVGEVSGEGPADEKSCADCEHINRETEEEAAPAADEAKPEQCIDCGGYHEPSLACYAKPAADEGGEKP